MYKIAVFLVAEAYQSLHAAAVAFALAARPDVVLTVFYNDPAVPRHLEQVRKLCGGEPLHLVEAPRTWLVRLARRHPAFGLSKRLVMRATAPQLNAFDAVIAVENTTALLRQLGVTRPKLIYLPHGAGDRARSFVDRIAKFDLVLPAGPKNTARMLARGLLRQGHYAAIGYPKFDAVPRHGRQTRLFGTDRPVILYNPHAMRDLGSWNRFAEPIVDAVRSSDEFNLIVAPHVKLFLRYRRRERDSWARRGCHQVLVDLGSDRSADMTYTGAADIYVGDVSSQVYEFLVEPRPCVFLNAHGIDWLADPNYRNWRLGEVVDDPADLLAALRRAQVRHPEFVGEQRRVAADALGDTTPGVAARAADTIMRFLRSEFPTAVPDR